MIRNLHGNLKRSDSVSPLLSFFSKKISFQIGYYHQRGRKKPGPSLDSNDALILRKSDNFRFIALLDRVFRHPYSLQNEENGK